MPALKPTAELRFISRRGARILQQKWAYDLEVADMLGGPVDPQEPEWRDIPFVEEPADASG